MVCYFSKDCYDREGAGRGLEDWCGGKAGVESDDCNSGFFRLANELFAIEKKGATGLDGDCGAAGAFHGAECAKSHHGDIEAHIVVVFSHLDDHGTAACDTAAPQDGRIGSFESLDGENDAILHDDGLADIQIANRHCDPGAECQVGFLFGGKGRFCE